MSTPHHTQSSAGLTDSAATAGKRFSRRQRIIWQIFAPPALGVMVMILPVMWWEVMTDTGSSSFDWMQLVGAAGIYLVAAFVMAGIPSVVFTLLMEGAFTRGLNPRSWSAVTLASALGGLAGFAMVTVPAGFVIGPREKVVVAVFGATGLAVGLVVGLVTKWRSAALPPKAKSAP